MASEQNLATAEVFDGEPALEALAGTTARSETSEPPLLQRGAQEHHDLTSVHSHMLKAAGLTKTFQSAGIPPDIRLRLEAVLASLEQWGKIQQQCTAEVSSIVNELCRSPSAVQNRLPEATAPGMRTATWEHFHRFLDSSETQHTIDILGNETTFSASESSGVNGVWVPERIRINSARVIYTVKNNFFAAETEHPTPATRPLIILRPFKRLLYYEKHIRALVGKLEDELDAETHTKSTVNFDDFMVRFEPLRNHTKSLHLSSFDDIVLYTKELRCLVDFMDKLIEPARKRLGTETDIVSFSELWFLYPAGTYIFVKDVDSAQKLWRIVQRTGGRREISSVGSTQERLSKHRYTNFVLDCYFIDYNGSRFFPVYGRFEIPPFDGNKAVASLSVVPIRIAEKEGLVDQDAIMLHGETFLQYCTKVRHIYYDGWSHHRDSKGTLLMRHLNTKIDSEVILDFKRAVTEDPSLVEHETEASVFRLPDDELSDGNLEIDNDSNWDKLLSDEICSSIRVPDSNGTLAAGRECMLILPDRVFGYVLRTRTWGKPEFHSITNITVECIDL